MALGTLCTGSDLADCARSNDRAANASAVKGILAEFVRDVMVSPLMLGLGDLPLPAWSANGDRAVCQRVW